MSFRRIQHLFRNRNNETPPAPKRPKRTFNRVENIESLTRRVVSIETRLNIDSLAKCKMQEQSPLFKLPAELRTLIFEYACLPYDDPASKYEVTDFYYRPEHQARHITSYSILLTCRRAWLEANHLPFQQGDHTFWFNDSGRRPKYLDDINQKEGNRIDRFIRTLTINNCLDLKHINIHSQMYWLERSLHLSLPLLLGNFLGACPEILTITITYSDWWSWEEGHPLRLDHAWLSQLLRHPAQPRLSEIRIELETIESKMKELTSVIAAIRQQFSFIWRKDNWGVLREIKLQESQPERTWSGTTKLGGKAHPPYESMKQLNYRIITLVWKVTITDKSAMPGTAETLDFDGLALVPIPDLSSLDSPRRSSSLSC